MLRPFNARSGGHIAVPYRGVWLVKYITCDCNSHVVYFLFAQCRKGGTLFGDGKIPLPDPTDGSERPVHPFPSTGSPGFPRAQTWTKVSVTESAGINRHIVGTLFGGRDGISPNERRVHTSAGRYLRWKTPGGWSIDGTEHRRVYEIPTPLHIESSSRDGWADRGCPASRRPPQRRAWCMRGQKRPVQTSALKQTIRKNVRVGWAACRRSHQG
jgi:hypothetical protein